MNLYISDLHFGHANVIRFDNRPFTDVEEMDRVMIGLWNGRVQEEDHVYVVGDFAFRNGRAPEWYLEQLRGHKHLIVGNHDNALLNDPKAVAYFESIEKMMHITDTYQGANVQIQLCHYPLAEWNKMKHGSWLIYGHIHNRRDEAYEFMKTREHALNAAAAINHYTPASFRELVENNRIFQFS